MTQVNFLTDQDRTLIEEVIKRVLGGRVNTLPGENTNTHSAPPIYIAGTPDEEEEEDNYIPGRESNKPGAQLCPFFGIDYQTAVQPYDDREERPTDKTFVGKFKDPNHAEKFKRSIYNLSKEVVARPYFVAARTSGGRYVCLSPGSLWGYSTTDIGPRAGYQFGIGLVKLYWADAGGYLRDLGIDESAQNWTGDVVEKNRLLRLREGGAGELEIVGQDCSGLEFPPAGSP